MSPERESRYITAYLRRKLPFMKSWDGPTTLRWVQWFMRQGRAIILGSDGRLAGVVLLRLVDEPEDAKDPFKDTKGRVMYVEATACEPGMMPFLFKQLRASFPAADTISWVRSKHGNRPFIAPINQVATRFV